MNIAVVLTDTQWDQVLEALADSAASAHDREWAADARETAAEVRRQVEDVTG